MENTMTYTVEDLKSIQLSIEHWWDNLNLAWGGCLERCNIDGDACPLCIKYFNCYNCPISFHTHAVHCSFTPWHKVRVALENDDTADRDKKIIESVIEEIEFLYNVRDFVTHRMIRKGKHNDSSDD